MCYLTGYGSSCNYYNHQIFDKPQRDGGEGNGTLLQYSCLENPMDGGAWWAAVHEVAKSQTWPSDFTFTFHVHALEKEMPTHSSILAWRIPGTAGPGGLPSMRSHRVGHDWSDLAAAAAAKGWSHFFFGMRRSEDYFFSLWWFFQISWSQGIISLQKSSLISLLRFPFLPPLQCVLLAWPVSRRKCLKRRGLEIREMITAKWLNRGGLDMVSVVTGARGKSKQDGDTGQFDHLWLEASEMTSGLWCLADPLRPTMWNMLMTCRLPKTTFFYLLENEFTFKTLEMKF